MAQDVERHPSEDTAVVSPVMVVRRRFAARPAAWPESRDFLSETLGPLDRDQATSRAVQDAVAQALLLSARADVGTFEITVRIFPDSWEIEILSDAPAGDAGPVGSPAVPASFAGWLSEMLARGGLSQEQAARQIGVSVRTVGRWLRGETEPRMRDMRKVSGLFGDSPAGARR